MPKKYKRNCNVCGIFYTGVGKLYCSHKCQGQSKDFLNKVKSTWLPKGIHPKTEFKKGHISLMGMLGKKHKLGTIEKMRSGMRVGTHNPTWKGDFAGYQAIHSWVSRWKGKPETCEECGKEGLKKRQIGWANIDHEYRRVLEEYIRLCTKCHAEYDLKLGLRFKKVYA